MSQYNLKKRVKKIKQKGSRIFIFTLASNNTSKKNIIIKTKTKTMTLLILMKSSHPTYHNNKIEEENKTTL